MSKEEVSRLMQAMRAPVQKPPSPQPVRVNSPRGCVIILGGSPSVVVKQGDKQ